MIVYNLEGLKDRRRELRKTQTHAEELLWAQLRNAKLGKRFKRQYSISGYVLDFYCPRQKLAIELEGEIHLSRKTYDDYRFRLLNEFGIRVLRISNEEINNNLSQVLEMLRVEINPLLTSRKLVAVPEERVG